MDTFPEQFRINRKVNRRDFDGAIRGRLAEENRRHDDLSSGLCSLRLCSFVNWHAHIISSRCDSRRFYDRFGVDASQRDGRKPVHARFPVIL